MSTQQQSVRDDLDLAPWIQTRDDWQFWPERPDPFKITIGTIATVLSRLPRFGGHTKKFYSVAQHSVHVAELVPTELKLAALLHDAAEAYSGFGDVCAPVKQLCPNIKVIEREIEASIAHRFGFASTRFRDERVIHADRVDASHRGT